MSITIEQTSYELLPVGDYAAVITDIQSEAGLYGPQLRFTFTIEGDAHNGNQLKGWCSAKFSPKSKLYEWSRAAFGGAEIPADYAFNSDHILGRKVTLSVIIDPKDDGTEFNKIQTVKRFRATPGQSDNGRIPASVLPAAQTEKSGDMPF